MGGFYGVVSKHRCVEDVFFGTDYHSHVGTKRAGMVFEVPDKGFRRSIHSLENAYFRNSFESDLPEFEDSCAGMGIISDTDPQPLLLNSHLGSFAIVTVCKINNTKELEQEFLSRRWHFLENFEGNINPTELIANLICEKDSFVAGIENVYDKIDGSCSMIILTESSIIAARDKVGRTPIVVGKKDGAYAVASESCSFPNTGYDIEYFLGPGEIVRLTADGYSQLRKPNKCNRMCAFMFVYYGYPNSFYEGINVEEVRYRCGKCLAQRDNITPDFCCGIPDSGVGHAFGYCAEKQIPYKRSYCKYTPTWPRSFMPQNQLHRDLVAKMKLIPNETFIKDQRILMIDDSIVRGTQLRDTTSSLRQAGAKEVHLRSACPPILFPCKFLNFSRSRSPLELIGRRIIQKLEGDDSLYLDEYSNPDTPRYKQLVDMIAKEMGLDSLIYQRLDDLIEAIGLPKDQLCTYCWDGVE